MRGHPQPISASLSIVFLGNFIRTGVAGAISAAFAATPTYYGSQEILLNAQSPYGGTGDNRLSCR